MKKVLILGANRGIGLSLAGKFKSKDYQVFVTCRQSSEELQALGVEVKEGIDLNEDQAILSLKEELPELDYVVYNAGIMRTNSFEQLKKSFDFSTLEEQYKTNALAPLKVALALSDKVKEGGKLFFITSRMGSIADNSSGGSYGYRASKCALNMFAKSLSVDLFEKKITVAVLHPGWVRTRMTEGKGLVDVDESAAGLYDRMEELSLEETGTFWHMNGEELSW